MTVRHDLWRRLRLDPSGDGFSTAGARPYARPLSRPSSQARRPISWVGSTCPSRCLPVVALALQVGVNYANDYPDGIRGTDAERVGPMRLVGRGVVPRAVKLAAFALRGRGRGGLVVVR